MITVSNLVRRFGSFTAVDDISFELERGDVVGFLGPNGAGKTTTMRMLTGFLPATRGTLTVAGHNVLTDSLEVRRRIGYLPESVPLYREHRVFEMLYFQARLHGMSRREAKQRIPEIVDRVGMGDRIRSLVGKLSKGQRQRIGLAVALLPNPEVLILDEPTSGLDPVQRIGVRQLIKELAQERTVLLSSHILPEVEAVCPRVIVLHRGKIAATGTREELVSERGGSYVALEARVGDVPEAMRALGALEDVEKLEHPAPSSAEYQRFEVQSAVDLREEVGALALASGWTVRELSWHRPTLEELFARLALELDPEPMASAAPTTEPALPGDVDGEEA